MQASIQKTFKILTPGSSLKRRVAYSLGIVRIILAPVIFLTIYYLVEMGAIVNRIVNIDAPATTLAEQISVEMLQARRSERSYFLLHDPAYLQANRHSVARIKQLVEQVGDLEPNERNATQNILMSVQRDEQQFEASVALLEEPGTTTTERVQQAVAAYETDLNELLRHSKRMGNAELIQELQSRVQSFDTELAKTLGQENPTLRIVAPELETTSRRVLSGASQLEAQGWERVQRDHQKARYLVQSAEWVLSIVSGITFLISVWITLHSAP
jgi:CHASE3 domain sensor protein